MIPLQAIYTLCGGTSMTLTEFIAILGGLAMLFTQMPTFHSLWYVPAHSSFSSSKLPQNVSEPDIVCSAFQDHQFGQPCGGSVFGLGVLHCCHVSAASVGCLMVCVACHLLSLWLDCRYQTVRFDLPRDYGLHTTPADKAFGTMTGVSDLVKPAIACQAISDNVPGLQVAIMHFAYGK